MRGAAGPWQSGLVLLACAALAGLAHLAISGEGSRTLEWSVAAASGLPHAGVCALLLWWFGRTLRGGREPLITGVARRVHGTLSAPIEAYTRQVTVAWCVFFAAQIAISATLFLVAPLEAWSLFVNVLNFPLIVLMFAGEYLVRTLLHPEHPRASIVATLRAFISADPPSRGARAP